MLNSSKSGRFVKFATILIILLLNTELVNTVRSNPDDTGKKTRKYNEITNIDITLNNNMNAKNISVFGLYLSMDIQEVKNKIELNHNIFIERDPFNSNRFYLLDKEKYSGKNIVLAYFIWEKNNIGLKEIVLYHGFMKYMIGNSKKLLTYDVLDNNSHIFKFFLGQASSKEVILDIPKIQTRSIAYYYANKNFKITKNITEQVVTFSLSFILYIDDSE